MRKHIKRILPGHETVRDNRWLRLFGDTLLHPRLWHLNRHSAAGGFAVGLFCGLIPGPFQMLGAAIMAIVFRINLPLAIVTTLYTNPLTIVPLYLVAFGLGQFVLGGKGHFVAPPTLEDWQLGTWLHALADWASGLGQPLGVGLVLLALLLAGLGYLLVQAAWRWHLLRYLRARRRRPAAVKRS
jgi:uncharacterized protein (DUF2062 family)